MDQERFDRWTMALATSGSRRGVLRGLVGGAAAALLGRFGAAGSVAQEAADGIALGHRCERGDRCRGGGRCKGGECRCAGPKKRCGNRCVSDRACCTGSRTGCPAGKVCRGGRCVPTAGTCTPDCDGKACGPDGCGGNCGPGCAEPETCTNERTCVACPPGTTGCGWGYGCVDLTSTWNSCGTCGHRCGRGEQCVNGRCEAPPMGTVPRGEACTANDQCDQTGGPAVCRAQHVACYQVEPEPSDTFCVGVTDGDGATCTRHCHCMPDAYCDKEAGRCRVGEWPPDEPGDDW